MFIALENKVGYPCTRTIWIVEFFKEKRVYIKFLKQPALMHTRNLMYFAREKISTFPFVRSLKTTCCTLTNQRIIISKMADLSRSRNFNRKRHISFEKQVSTRYHKEDLEFFSFKGKGLHFPSQALVHKRNLYLARGR